MRAWATAEPEDARRLSEMRLLLWSELGTLPPRRPLIKGLLDQGAFSLLYGASNTGKTALALRLAVSVATGGEWCGRSVVAGPVLYIAAEGGLGIGERLEALRLHLGMGSTTDIPLAVLPDALDVRSSTRDIDRLIAALPEHFPAWRFSLIVVDTLSRTFAGGNENGSDDMGAFIANCDRLRAATGAHVLLIHHSGKDDGKGARGHSALRAAVDTEIEVTREDDGVAMNVTKQRDRAGDAASRWSLQAVEIGRDDEGDPRTSVVAVLVEGETGPRQRTRAKRLNATAEQGLVALRQCVAELGVLSTSSANVPSGAVTVTKKQWRTYLELSGVVNPEGNPREQVRRILVTLKSAGFAGSWEEYVWIVT